MIFTFYHERLKDVPFLCVDGVVEAGLNLSHWPGNRTPAHLKADTSTEMALNLARDPGRDSWLEGVSIVSRVVARRFTRSLPMSVFTTRWYFGTVSLLYRLRARVDVQAIDARERIAAGWGAA